MIEISSLPARSGCYLFKDKNGDIIYIGKAKNIKNRVKAYYSKNSHHPKTQAMMDKIHEIDIMVTKSEVEALLLENALIKRHQPHYNIRLKDAKTYAYIRCTDEIFPRFVIARRRGYEGDYFGPFVSAQERDRLLRFLQKTFLLRTCKKLPKKPCLRYHMHTCIAPCRGDISVEQYKKRVVHAKKILQGKKVQLIKEMEAEMKNYAARNEFENALIIRNQIAAIERLGEGQIIDRKTQCNEDVINYVIQDGKVYLVVFNIYQGLFADKDEFIFDVVEDFFHEFILQYYDEHPIPKELIVPSPLDGALTEYLSQKKQKKVVITVPQRGVKKKLLELAWKNIHYAHFNSIEKGNILGERLGLRERLDVIECFDISHLSGTAMAGSMVQYRTGKPSKSNYRRFKIKTVKGIDDCAAIAEVIHRQYFRVKQENIELPDLIIVDGGKAQLNAAYAELVQLDLAIPVISIAKHMEEVFVLGKARPLHLKKSDKALQYIQEIRDEAHRFATLYYRVLRKKDVIQ